MGKQPLPSDLFCGTVKPQMYDSGPEGIPCSKLRERRYLASVARFMQKQVYGIGSKSVPFLIEQGYAPSDLADKRLRHHELTEIGIRHLLFVADIHARMIALTRSGPAELVLWQEGQLPWDSVTARKGDPEIPVRSDAYFVLKRIARLDGRSHVHVFLEADRSTMAHSRMAAKIAGYLAYYEQDAMPGNILACRRSS